MEERRKTAGREIKTARRAAKFRSQKAFADHIGVHESSVANAETGSDRIGESVFEAIERGLGWPVGSITAYIATGGTAPWDGAAPSNTSPAVSEPEPEDDWTPEEVERVRGMSAEQIVAEARMIGRFSGEEAQLRYLRKAATVKLEKSIAPPR